MKSRRLVAVFIALFGFVLASSALAQAPETMTYHGMLSAADGTLLEATVPATFEFFDAVTGGTSVWKQEFETIDVNRGSFTANLGGQGNPLSGIFDGTSYWLEISIDGDVLEPRTRIDSVPYALRATNAANADTLDGKTVSEIVSQASGGSGDATAIQELRDELAALKVALEAKIAVNTASISTNTGKIATNATAISTNAGKIATNTTAISTNAGKIATNTASITTNTTAISTNAGKIATNTTAISTNAGKIATNTGDTAALKALTQHMTREQINGKTSMVFTGVNVHVRSGGNFTGSAVNGLGNLIVGYDEGDVANKTGSHNLVVGRNHTYKSYAGFVAGSGNSVLGPNASVSGGFDNTASADGSSVCGGRANKATAYEASVCGGRGNTASGQNSSISGGSSNVASGINASISGGTSNLATGPDSSVLGGLNNQANGNESSVSGGEGNKSNGNRTSVLGNKNVTIINANSHFP